VNNLLVLGVPTGGYQGGPDVSDSVHVVCVRIVLPSQACSLRIATLGVCSLTGR